MLAERKCKGGKGDWDNEDTKENVDPKERDGPKESGQIQVTRGTILGIIPTGTARCTVLRLIRGRLLNLFPIFVQSQFETESRGVF